MTKVKRSRDMDAWFNDPKSFRNTPIDDMLAWQKMIDEAPASINMTGAHRFWNTVAQLLGKRIYTSGSPDFEELIIELTPEVGLKLTADYNKYVSGPNEGEPVFGDDFNVDMDYRFVDMNIIRGGYGTP